MIKIKQNLYTGLFVLTLISSIFSCEETTSKVENTEATELKVELNEGKKWKANPETTQGIQNMKEIINQFDENSRIQVYKSLSEELESEFTMIFQRCTMKGEAHNQLHNYLIPLKDYIKGLRSDKQEIAQSNYKKIIPHISAYSNYFE